MYDKTKNIMAGLARNDYIINILIYFQYNNYFVNKIP